MSDEHRRSEDKLLNKILKFWPIILSLIGGIYMVSNINQKVEIHEARITRLEQYSEIINDVKRNTDLLVREANRRRRDN